MKNHFPQSPKATTLLQLLCSGLLAACHNKAEEDAPVKMPGTISLTGAGATFLYPIYSKWFDEYRKQHPNVTCARR